MARKPTIDVDRAIQMLREGQSTQAIADYFGVSRQAIDLHRRKLIQTGQLADKRAPRSLAPVPSTASSPASGSTASSVLPITEPPEPTAVSLDRVIDLTINAFGSLKKVPQLEAELAQCRQDYEKATRRIAELEQELKKRQEQESRWNLAMTGDAIGGQKPPAPPA